MLYLVNRRLVLGYVLCYNESKQSVIIQLKSMAYIWFADYIITSNLRQTYGGEIPLNFKHKVFFSNT